MAYNDIIDRTGADALIPLEYSTEIVQELTEQSAVMQLATRGPDLARDQKEVPVLQTLPTAYFVDGDTGLIQTTDVDWTNVNYNVGTIACIVPIPDKVIQDSDYEIWGQVKPLIAEAIGIVFDNAVLWGTNKPSSWPTALKTTANTASNNVALGTGADLYADLLGESGIISKIEADGYMANGHISAMGLRGKLRDTRDANGGLIFQPSLQERGQYDLDGVPIVFPKTGIIAGTAGTAWMVSGDWSKLLYAVRNEITYAVSSEAVISDAAGNIVYNLFQQRMTAMRVTFDCAWVLPNPVNRLQATAASRCRFAFLTT